MAFQIDKSKGWTEIIIDSDCEFYKFEKVATLLATKLNITISERLNDFDSHYLTFSYNGSDILLHYNIFSGVSILPKSFKEANQLDNENVIAVAQALMPFLEEFNWALFNDGKTIGSKGSENGIIISDFENFDGARITLEIDCGDISFAVTLGIYGLLLHTHFDNNLENSHKFIKEAKNKINMVFEMYNVPEERRSDLWQGKHDRLINELAENA